MSLNNSTDDDYSIDPTQPLRGIIVCCTSIPTEQRSEIDHKVGELGGVHKYDLTPDVTHLIVGDYDTPKYRHVARERPDIKAMDAAWIDAIAQLWKFDDDIDLRQLEDKYKLRPLDKCGREPAVQDQPTPEQESLLVCLTGFGEQRDQIAERITANGARYTGDLTRKCTHLIVGTPEGKKFTAAKAWGVRTVTLAWLDQSIERGMILDEAKFDPLLPVEEQGVDAWVKKVPRRRSSGKRSRSSGSTTTEDGVRKLRKTASMKLSSQRNTLWDNILGRSDSKEYSFSESRAETAPLVPEKPAPLQPSGIFAKCAFFIHGFRSQQTEVLYQTIKSLDGTIVSSLDEAAALKMAKPCGRFVVVPQNSQPDTHPQSRHDDINFVTEFYIERCLQNKKFFRPEEHVLGRPFPLFPIPDFSSLTICTSAFTGLELNQVARSIKQLGATFEEQFRRDSSLLVCRSIEAIRKDKLRYAVEWGVPVVSAEWLWQCIDTGYKIPPENYIFPELKARYANKGEQSTRSGGEQEPAPPRSKVKATTSRPPGGAGMDPTAFDRDTPEKPQSKMKSVRHEESTTSADFVSAVTHPEPTRQQGSPLSELSSASVNKSPSPTKTLGVQLPRHKSDPNSNIENQKQATGRAPSAPPTTRHDSSSDEDKARGRRDEERRAARAADRQQFTSKIATLLDPAEGQPSMGMDLAGGGTAPSHRPRKRQILGRAVSNVSNASSISGPAPESLRSASAIGAEGEDELGEERQPPATQLEYGDPDAQKRKAQLVSRMMEQPVGDEQTSAAAEGRTLRKRT
ncbi:subunit of DNA polymerase II [Cordyceps javanica]|uniref:Subunit of DNA polymerase II n=1 Tax=Cordyceps javanica TaxID=43265 RepID=A0A545UR18_9HYPO|nr:subunit of DNA polymerase II [Cordyceps javanica]TQW03854.1 subunit of DNA polymerase II [Cordyceps javanica]